MVGEGQHSSPVIVVGDGSGDGNVNGALKDFWQAIRRRREETTEVMRNKWRAILFGQLLAFLAACVNASSFSLENKFSVVTPMFQMCVVYVLLSSHRWLRSTSGFPSFTVDGDNDIYINFESNHDLEGNILLNASTASAPTIYYKMPLLGTRIRVPWWIYFLISVLDLGAGIMTLQSLKYTSLTSTTLLGSLCIPSTMFFSRYLLDKKFLPHHYAGVCLCIIGGSITILADFDSSSLSFFSSTNHMELDAEPKTEVQPAHSHSYFGDMLAVGASIMYGLGDTVAEYSIKHVDRTEYLGMLGVFGAVLAGIMLPFLKSEVQILSDLFAQPLANMHAIAVMVCYILFLFSYYISLSLFLERSDATLLNLSLQAANLWTMIFSFVAFYDPPNPTFYFALILVVSGVVFYETKSSSTTADDNSPAAHSSSSTSGSSNEDTQSILSHSSSEQLLNYNSLEESR